MTSIGTKAFNNCSKLESINVDADNANYASEDGVLLNKAKETLIQYPGGKSGSYTIPASVTTIVDNAFYKCSIASVTIPANVTSIGIYAFYQCTNLSSVTFEANSQLKTIGESAFYKCSIASVTIPANVTSIGQNAFYSCTNLSQVTFEANSQLKTIDDDAFYGCNNAGFTSIDIPASVTYIGWRTFYCCSNLTTITLNSNPCIFKDAGFPSGANVTMNLTATVRANGEYWMTFYTSHNNYQVPAGTQIFKAELSDDKLTLRELTTDKIVTEGKAVILKSETASITLTRTTSASSNDFDTDNSLSGVFKSSGKEVEDPSTTYALNSGAQGVGFYKVPTGNTIGVGNAYVTSTSTSDFLPLVVVTSGTCGDTSENEGKDVTWNYDTTTKTLTISGTGPMMYYGSALDSDSKYHSTAPWSHLDSEIQKVIVGDGVTYIGSYAFAYCTALTSVSLPASVMELGQGVFYTCTGLERITLPTAVSSIGADAFGYCNQLTRIEIPRTEKVTLGAGAFDNGSASLAIVVPATLLKTYQEADNWSAYAAKLVGVLSEATGFGTGFATGNYEYTRTFKCGVASTVCLPFSVTAAQAASVGKFYRFAGIDKNADPWEVIMEEADPTAEPPVSGNEASTLTANTPYLFKPYIFDGKSQGDEVEFTFSGTVSSAGNAGYSGWIESGTSNEWAFQGVYYNYAWNEGNENLGKVYGFAALSYDGAGYTVNPGDFVKAGAGASIAPFRAFLQCNTVSLSAPRRGAATNDALPSRMTVRLVNADGNVTEIETTNFTNYTNSDAWFTLDGRKLDKQPTAKGVYIHGGRKVVIK